MGKLKMVQLIYIIALLSCSDKDSTPIGGTVIDLAVDVFVKDVDSKNLLVTKGFNKSITVIDSITGLRSNFGPNHSGYVLINAEEGSADYSQIRFFFNGSGTRSVLYIDWNNGRRDTLMGLIKHEGYVSYCQKVFHNATLVWEAGVTPSIRSFTIIHNPTP